MGVLPSNTLSTGQQNGYLDLGDMGFSQPLGESVDTLTNSPQHVHNASSPQSSWSSPPSANYETSLPTIDSVLDVEPPIPGSEYTRRTDQIFRCGDCFKEFLQQCLLTKHLRIHTRPLLCECCPQDTIRFAERKDLNRHYWSTHRTYAQNNKIPREYKACPDCDYEGRTDNLRRHRQNQHQQ